MLKQNRIFFIISILFAWNTLYSMSFDNRYLPLIQHPFLSNEFHPAHYKTDFFVITASSAFSKEKDNIISISELFGPYRLRDIGCALEAIGLDNPLVTDPLIAAIVEHKELQWRPKTKLQAQGFNFTFQQPITTHLSIGCDLLCMHVEGRQEYHLLTEEKTTFTPVDILRLDSLRVCMNSMLGIQDEYVSQVGFGDIITYLRWGTTWDYIYKFRRIEAGLRVGALIPTGQQPELNHPMSVPFGGGGFPGIYVCGDLEFEVKEDWKVGLWFQVNKRFSRTQTKRFPACKESPLYGAIKTQVTINPGPTVILYPYICFENLRKGLGMRVLYSLVHHATDSWSGPCLSILNQTSVTDIEKNTKWSSEHVTLNAFYDFGKEKKQPQFDTILQFFWDIPVSWLACNGATRASKITIGVEFNF